MVLVTDAIAGAGLPEGEHRFGSQTMEIKGNRAVIKGTQTLCGRYSLYRGLILISMIKLWDTVFSSPELKAQVSFSDHLFSGVCLSVCPSVCLSVCLSVC